LVRNLRLDLRIIQPNFVYDLVRLLCTPAGLFANVLILFNSPIGGKCQKEKKECWHVGFLETQSSYSTGYSTDAGLVLEVEP
jgi:hypothetical protein